ncbi:branched-chain amino acid transport protein, AzlC family [Campylobacter cuniculorum DSM 23162 = LMG 24588]|uniref:Branched-chain amino acid transport protein, AzlC family n=1 Tax=Campylobacter cuniculorum DSM 23162 = LMG 24588 TaxID=1121267 RepID=A0A1W6BWT4_9BACT|nr:AzlC family ABC transporter permease [Campylobacter cuniculorum]ARJ56566.1 branched-chain amino acid transport protein, AzlC family [Campylobacter cuniculorum DSM 23162 = LMG 24588]
MIKQENIFILTLPIFMGYISLGAAFGILASSNGFSLFEVVLSSLIVYAGAGQFVLVALIVSGAGFLEIFITLFILNFRHFFYTLALITDLKGMNFLKHYIMFSLTDETFALLSAQRNELIKLNRAQKSWRVFWICFLNQNYWIIGSILGFLFQKNVKIDYSGVEFSLNALFIVLTYELFKQNPNLKILLGTCCIALIALFFIDKSYMFAFCLALAIFLLFIGRKYV